jgi:predicted nuclease of predicted toxin-antitoxin system
VARVRYYLDEHVANAVARGLRARGTDVITVAEAGLRGRSDEEQLAWARGQGRVLFSQDVDFLRLHAQGRPHAGIVHAPPNATIGRIVRSLLLVRDALSAEEMENRVEFL